MSRGFVEAGRTRFPTGGREQVLLAGDAWGRLADGSRSALAGRGTLFPPTRRGHDRPHTAYNGRTRGRLVGRQRLSAFCTAFSHVSFLPLLQPLSTITLVTSIAGEFFEHTCIKRNTILPLFSDYSDDTTELFQEIVALCLPIPSCHRHKHADLPILINC